MKTFASAMLFATVTLGSGDIYFDDVLIRKGGQFVLDELLPLNPDKLKKLG